MSEMDFERMRNRVCWISNIELADSQVMVNATEYGEGVKSGNERVDAVVIKVCRVWGFKLWGSLGFGKWCGEKNPPSIIHRQHSSLQLMKFTIYNFTICDSKILWMQEKLGDFFRQHFFSCIPLSTEKLLFVVQNHTLAVGYLIIHLPGSKRRTVNQDRINMS